MNKSSVVSLSVYLHQADGGHARVKFCSSVQETTGAAKLRQGKDMIPAVI